MYLPPPRRSRSSRHYFTPSFKVHATAWLPAIAYQISTETGSKPPAGTILARGEINVARIRQNFYRLRNTTLVSACSPSGFRSKHNSLVENAVVNFLGKIAAESSTRICFKFPCRVPK